VTIFEAMVTAAKRGEYSFVLAHADECLLQGDCPSDQVGWVFFYKCDAALSTDKPVLAIAAGEQALTWALGQKASELEGRSRIWLACALLKLGRTAEVIRLLELYVDGLLTNPLWQKHEQFARYNLAVAYRHSGRLPDAITQYGLALQLPVVDASFVVQIRQNLAWAMLLLGDQEGAREQLDLVAQSVRESLSLSRLTSLWVDRAALYLLEGHVDQAKSACHQVLDALDEKNRAVHLATTYITLGRIALQEGDRAEAMRCCMLGRTHAEHAERWDLHNEATRVWVSASEKGGARGEESGFASVIRLLVRNRGD
jgi:tetratricopeptide (TPR) repeat protein